MGVMDYYHQGVKLIQQNKYDAAIAVFNTALAEYPDSFVIFDIRASAYCHKGEHEKALADYDRMVALEPHHPDGWSNRGNLYHELGEYDKAIADYTQCIPLSPKGYGTYWSSRGISYYEKGDLDSALADLAKAIECWSEPEYADWALLYRGLVWKKKGDLDKALEDFTLAATYEPRNHDALFQAGFIWFEREEYEKAIECFSGAIAVRDDEADYWLARGVCYWNKCLKDHTGFYDMDGKTIDLAEDDFAKAIACAPDRADAYFNRGMARGFKARESNNLIKAIVAQKAAGEAERTLLLARLEHMGGKKFIPQADALLRGLRSNRDQVDVLMAQSSGLMATNYAGEAIEDLTRAIALDPNHAEACYQRGLVYALTGEADKALADYEQTCALDPNHLKAAEKRKELLKSRQ
jgi:tetratricopeptide (TPR) repeat protein